jgi:hypothetical protein
VTFSSQKIRPLCENILSSGDDIAGAVNILCWMDGDEGMQRICVCRCEWVLYSSFTHTQLKFISTAKISVI